MDFASWINQNLTAIDVAVLYLIVSSAVQALPEPNTSDPKLYQWLYKFSHAVVANWRPAVKKVETKKVQDKIEEIEK